MRARFRYHARVVAQNKVDTGNCAVKRWRFPGLTRLHIFNRALPYRLLLRRALIFCMFLLLILLPLLILSVTFRPANTQATGQERTISPTTRATSFSLVGTMDRLPPGFFGHGPLFLPARQALGSQSTPGISGFDQVPGRQALHTRYPASAMANPGSPCDSNKPLNDPDQPQSCTWQILAGYNPLLICIPDSATTWLANNPQLYDCYLYRPQEQGGGYYYCNVPTAVALNQAAIRCSQTKGGKILPCLYSYTTIGFCISDPCGTDTTTTFDPITGIPQPSTDTTTPPPVCAVTVSLTCNNTFDSANDWIFGSTSGLLFATSSNQTGINTYYISIVQNTWGTMVAIALALLAIPFALAGYQIMLGLGSANHARAVERIGRVLLIALAVVLSFFILKRLINVEDGLAQYFSSSFRQTSYITMPSSNWECYAKQFFGNLFNLNIYGTMNAAQKINVTTYTQDMTTTTLMLIENLPNYVLTLLSILLAIQLVVRLALLNLHIILSPLTIICEALPNHLGSNAGRYWIKGFTSLLFVQILQLVILVLGSKLIPLPGSGGTDWVTTLFSDLVPILVLTVTLNIPRLFNAPAANLLSTASSSIGGAMSGIALIIRGL